MSHKLRISEKLDKALKKMKPALVNIFNANTNQYSNNQESRNRAVNGSLERADAGFSSNLIYRSDSVAATTAHQSRTAGGLKPSKIVIIDIDSD